MEIQGIDVSVHQGQIDWPSVKKAGIGFAFVRMGYCGYAGEIHQDSKFQQNMNGARQAGIPAGVYLYSYAKTPQAAGIAADETLKLLESYHLEYPVAFDIEDKLNVDMSKGENTAIVEAYLSRIEEGGYYAMLYTYLSFANCNLDMAALSKYDLWIAHYANACGYKGKHGIWQYTGSGRVGGISTDVDRNVAYQDYTALTKKR